MTEEESHEWVRPDIIHRYRNEDWLGDYPKIKATVTWKPIEPRITKCGGFYGVVVVWAGAAIVLGLIFGWKAILQ